jgi:hypothetical protein
MARPTVTEALFVELAEAAGLEPNNVNRVSIVWDADDHTKIAFTVYPNEKMTEILDRGAALE